MPITDAVTVLDTGQHQKTHRDPVTGNIITTPTFPSLIGGVPVAPLSIQSTVAIVAKINEIITRLNLIISELSL